MEIWREVLSQIMTLLGGANGGIWPFALAGFVLILAVLVIKYGISIEAKFTELFYFRLKPPPSLPQSQQRTEQLLPLPAPDRKFLQSGKELRRLRVDRRVTQHDLANAINTSDKRISDIETGKKKMFSDEVVRVALALRLSNEELADFIRLIQDEYQ
jgi:DNA-binding XRE family transcriptional regulator